MVPTPKYNIGQKVFVAIASSHVPKKVPCPDCLGERQWSVTTPAGETFPLACSTCVYGWEGSRGTVERYPTDFKVSQMTIGSVRIDTNDVGDGREPISYMCIETGVGSGTCWYESRLFDTREQATIDGARQVAEIADLENTRLADIEKHRKKESKKKPEWWQRRILELEAKIAELIAIKEE